MPSSNGVALVHRPEARALDLVPAETALRLGVLPLRLEGRALVIAMREDPEKKHIEKLEAATRMRIVVEPCEGSDLLPRIREAYALSDREVDGTQRVESRARELLLAILRGASAVHASDIHLDALASGLGLVRVRVDGDLAPLVLPAHLRGSTQAGGIGHDEYEAIVSVIKHDCNLHSEVKKQFQSGSFKAVADRREFFVRVEVIPGVYGERLTMRLIGNAGHSLRLDELGMDRKLLHLYGRALAVKGGAHGIVGPQGCGKSTTARALIASSPELAQRNILTIEDPVEEWDDRFVQVDYDAEAGRTFASAARSFLRADADAMFLGEVRDEETALGVVRAGLAMTTLFTIHARLAVDAIFRLEDFGVPRRTLGVALRSLLAQRILRLNCERCLVEVPTPVDLRRLYPEELEGVKNVKRGSGRAPEGAPCSHCGGSGVSGRIGVFELFVKTPMMEDLIVSETSRIKLLMAATQEGYELMQFQAAKLIAAGRVSVESARRELDMDEGVFH